MLEIVKRNAEEIIVALIFIFFAMGLNIYRVQGDGLYYYAFLEKILNIPNPESSAVMLEQSRIFSQRGCSYFNMPFYLAAYLIEKIFHLNLNFNGITLRQISINLASNFYLILSLVLIAKILKLMKLKNVIFPIVSVLFSTSTFTVAVIQPSMTHAVDIFINTLFIYLIVSGQENQPFKYLWLGIVSVIAILVRYFNFLLIIPVIVYYLSQKRFKELKFLLIGFLGSAWIIPLLFYTHNGTFNPFFGSGMTITSTITDSASVIIPLVPKYLLKLLVHPLHGLLVWAPITIFSAVGLVFAPKKKEKLGYLFIGTWFMFLFLYGFLQTWSAGWSFNNRYLANLFPIYVIGLSIFIDKYGKKTLWFLIPLTFFSIILFLNWHLCIMNPEFETPADLVKIWIKGKSSTFMDGTVNLKTVLTRLWEWCRYKYIFRFLK